MPRKNKITYEVYQARIDKIYGIGVYTVYKDSFINTRHKIKVHCNIHNIDFVTDPHSFECGNTSCKKCQEENRHKPKLLWISVYKKFIQAYGNKFTYDENSFNGMKKEMIVQCNDCGTIFKITPVHHLKYNNGGCPICRQFKTLKCSICGKDIIVNNHCSDNLKLICDDCKNETKQKKEKQQNQTIKEKRTRNHPWEYVYKLFVETYGEHFTYDSSTYKDMITPMTIHCNTCGETFQISPKRHLHNNNGGCPICGETVIKKCVICGKEILIGKHVKNVICDECDSLLQKERKENRNKKENKEDVKCLFCGQYHSYDEKCPNEECNLFYSINNLKKLIPFGFDYSSIGTLRYLDEFNKAV